jgi:hypothetical protein
LASFSGEGFKLILHTHADAVLICKQLEALDEFDQAVVHIGGEVSCRNCIFLDEILYPWILGLLILLTVLNHIDGEVEILNHLIKGQSLPILMTFLRDTWVVE